MSVTTEDKAIAKSARAALAKSPLDISELIVSCSKGCIELSGKIKVPRDHTGSLNVRKEFTVMKAQLHNVRGVRDVTSDRVRIFE